MQIEEIIQGKKGKLIIRAEGGLSFPLYEKEAAKYRLTEGGTLTEQEWNEICSEILEKRAKRRAMYIARRFARFSRISLHISFHSCSVSVPPSVRRYFAASFS